VNLTISASDCELASIEALVDLAEYITTHCEYGDNRRLKAKDLMDLRASRKVLKRLLDAAYEGK
jgi:hypothetical protein